jgi:uncharacterized membrane protein HdeD (DUF308 family)
MDKAAVTLLAVVLLIFLGWFAWVAIRDQNVALAVLIGAFLIFTGLVRLRP